VLDPLAFESPSSTLCLNKTQMIESGWLQMNRPAWQTYRDKCQIWHMLGACLQWVIII